jgi:gamma-glutamyltranspeptidase/glutathione hydrolase
MRLKRIAGIGCSIAAVSGGVAAAIYYFETKDPKPIKVDAKQFDDYAGYYVFPSGFPITIKRDGDRLMSSMPEHAPMELFAETETQFFHKGRPARWSFHRADNGAVDYAVARWKNDEEKAKKMAALPLNPEGTDGLIAATTGAWATEAGLEILKEGGTAADAAMATAICEVVHVGGSYVSFAGPMMMVYYDAASGRVYYMDAEYATPLQETDPRSIPGKGGRTALVPGFFAGVQAAHDRFGKVPFERLFEKAIAVAEEGEEVSAVMQWWIDSKKGVLGRYPDTKKIFTRPDGNFYVKGDLFRQPELAATLKNVASRGAAYIYDGDWGRKFVEVIQRAGGRITIEDMKRYHAIWEQPLQTTYREYTVYATGPTPWGGVNIIQALNLLELADLRRFGPYTTSPQSLFWLMEIAACQSSTRDLPPETRITKQSATSIWNGMKNGAWSGLPKAMRKQPTNSPHTDGLVVVDKWGNMAVVNHTINTMLWGKTGLFVDGISIPDSASFQGGDVAKAGPGNRLPNGMSPLIVCLDGKPVLGSAATGGGLHAKTLQVLVNILDFGMDPQTAVDTPAFVGWNPGQVEVDTFDPRLLDELRQMGLKVEMTSPQAANISRGYWAGVQVDPVTRLIRGGVTRGLESAVVAY